MCERASAFFAYLRRKSQGEEGGGGGALDFRLRQEEKRVSRFVGCCYCTCALASSAPRSSSFAADTATSALRASSRRRDMDRSPRASLSWSCRVCTFDWILGEDAVGRSSSTLGVKSADFDRYKFRPLHWMYVHGMYVSRYHTVHATLERCTPWSRERAQRAARRRPSPPSALFVSSKPRCRRRCLRNIVQQGSC